MDIESSKRNGYKLLGKLDKDVRILGSRIEEAIIELALVETPEQAKAFDEKFDLEAGLAHIRIF